MTSEQNIIDNDVNSVASLLVNLSQYSLTYLYISYLYTYEIIILLMYTIMVIFSFFTNLTAIIIFSIGRRSPRSKLSPFLLNLSVFNIIMTVSCIPFTIPPIIFQQWFYPRGLCIVVESLKTFSISGVLLTLIAIAIDRYFVVKYPLAIKVYSVR